MFSIDARGKTPDAIVLDEAPRATYTSNMRRIQIYIEEELDEALQAEARTGRSKAAIIRESVKARIGRPGQAPRDPITALVGSIDVEPADVDEEVYGR